MFISIENTYSRCLLLPLLLLYDVSCLTMDGVMVPAVVVQGDTAELQCLFSLQADKLYSVSWYKDHEEFYRYVPKDTPRQHTYRLDGAKVDKQRSDAKIVVLRGTRPPASGLYRCEVSAEAPSFTSVSGEGRMDVLSLPSEGPQISGDVFPRDYREGDLLALNCSAEPSHPPAKIRWLVNDRQMQPWFEVPGTTERGAWAGLQLRLSRHHFPRGRLAVRCLSTVGAPPLGETREALLLVHGSSKNITLSWKLYVCASIMNLFASFYIYKT